MSVSSGVVVGAAESLEALLPSLDPLCPEINYVPRLAACAVAAPAATSTVHVGHGCAVFQTAYLNGEVNQSWAFVAPPASLAPSALCPARLRLWRRSWGTGPAHRIMLAAAPVAAADALVDAYLRLGRALTFREEFETWQPAAASAPPPPPAAPLPAWLEAGALAADDAGVVNAHWKYGGEPGGSVEERLRESVARLPSACLRLRADAAAPPLSAAQAAEIARNRGLAAWVLMRADGSLGVLTVLPTLRGLGLATHAVRALAARIDAWRAAELRAAGGAGARAALLARAGLHSHVNPANTASVRVFRGLGWSPVNKVAWLAFGALAPRFRLRAIDAASGDEWADLLELVNASYRQDDAFFVDMTRSDMANLHAMGGCAGRAHPRARAR
jgi:hypothetical protein